MKINLRYLKRRGFDLSKRTGKGRYRVRCSQCEAATINGVPCHEHGCPHIPKPVRDDE